MFKLVTFLSHPELLQVSFPTRTAVPFKVYKQSFVSTIIGRKWLWLEEFSNRNTLELIETTLVNGLS